MGWALAPLGMLSGIINRTEWLRNKEKLPFFKLRGNSGAVTIKFEAVVTVAGVIEPFIAFAMMKA